MAQTIPSRAPTVARRLARAALGLRRRDLTDAVLRKAKICLLDFLGCAFEARALPASRQAIAVTPRAGAGAQVIGTSLLASPADAAFANAVMGHGLVREDMHAPSVGHHGVVVWPALLALSQRARTSGSDLLVAAVVGYEAAGRIGRALFDADLARLFRPTGLASPLGAALAGARMIGLDEEAAATALALAANTSSGLNQWPHTGASEMYFHAGFAARNAVTAVELAAAGATASPDIIEGEAGLIAAFRRRPAREAIALFADGRAEILSVYNKPAPACNYAQTASQAALLVARALGSRWRRIERVSIRVPAAAVRYPGCDHKGPFATPLQAKMSIPYAVAAALVRGELAESSYALPPPRPILRLAAAAELAAEDGLTAAYPARQGAEVEVALADGTRLAQRLDDVVPATPAEIRARFRAAAAAAVGERAADEIERTVDALDALADAGRLAALCAPRPATRSRVRAAAHGRMRTPAKEPHIRRQAKRVRP
jgi:2-methylcitrate dehydratase PrpD